GVVVLSGLLDLGGGTLENTPDGTFSDLVISGGTVLSGTIFAEDGTLGLPGATFDAVTFQGGLAVGTGASLTVLDGLKVLAVDGVSPGTLNLNSGGVLQFSGTQSLDDMTLNIGASVEVNGGTLTFGSGATLNVTTSAAQLAGSGTFLNEGLVN